MLSIEQIFLIQALSDYLNGRKTTEIPEDFHISVLAKLARDHQCEGILYYQTRLPELQAPFVYNSYYAVKRRKILAKIHQVFAKKNIPYLIFKGTEIAEITPVAYLRSMGDSDILVHPEDKMRAHQCLLALGFHNIVKAQNEWIYYKDDLQFELHSRLMNEELVSFPSHQDFMSKVWEHASSEDGIQYHLDWNYHLAFLMLHLRKHFMNSGVGFRQFMDVAVVSQKCDIDWEELNNTIESLEIAPFVSVCYAFIKRWFDLELPVKSADIHPDFYEEATQQIFNNGVFGFHDPGNKENYTVIQLGNHGKTGLGYTLGKIKLICNFCFPSYKSMTDVPQYAFLKGKPFLLPAAWAYRMIAAKSQGLAPSRMEMINTKLSLSEEQITERLAYLKKWGL